MNKILTLAILFIAFTFGCTQKSENDASETENETSQLQPDADNGGISLPDGFGAIVAADTLGKAGHMAALPNGDLYVQLRRSQDGVGIIAMRDSDHDGKFEEQVGFKGVGGTGIGIYNNYLYASTSTSVHRFKLKEGSLLPDTTNELVISGYPKQSQHETKSLTFDGDGHIYVNIGAPSNACMEQTRTKGSPGMDPCPLLEEHAGIWQYDADKLNQDAYADGKRYVTGTRNIVALDWNFVDDHLYAVQHGRDQLNSFFPDMYTTEQSAELPAEEFLRLSDGSNGGWPYCYYDWHKNKKVLMPEYGGDGEMVTEKCEDKTMPEIGFPGHMAPNDLIFYTGEMFPEKYRNGAFIAFHGSWNRAPEDQYGFFVVFVPFSNGRVSGDYEIFASGFEGPEPVKSPGNATYRPCGLAVGPDGSLYVSEDQKGRIWKIIYKG